VPILVAAISKAWICGRLRAGTGGFESCRRHGCLPPVGVACCQVQVTAEGWSLVQRIRTSVISKPQKWGDRGRRELSSGEKKYCSTIPGRLRGGRAPQSAGSPNAAIDSRLKYDKIYVGFSDKRYRAINLSLSVL